MAQVRVLAQSFINNSLVNEGDVIEYDGEISENLELVKSKRSKKGADAPTDSADEEQPQVQAPVELTPSATGVELSAQEEIQVVSQEQAGE